MHKWIWHPTDNTSSTERVDFNTLQTVVLVFTWHIINVDAQNKYKPDD